MRSASFTLPPFVRHATARAALLAVFTCLGTAAWAQPASQVTPRDLRPEPQPVAPAPALPAGPREAAPAAPGAELQVTVARIEVTGDFPERAAATARLTAPVAGQRVTVAQLYQIAEAIEAEYRDAGYPLVRVVIPPQSVTDGGVFRITVLDGFIELVDVTALPERLRGHVERLSAPLVGRPRLTSEAMERVLTLAGRVPGLALRSTLAAGTRAGGSVLVLEADYELVTGSYGVDNRLSDSLGPWQATLQGRLNQPLGQGEQLYVYVGGHPNPVRMLRSDARRRVAGAGVIVPIAHDGLALNFEHTWSDTKTPASTFVPPTQSRFERSTLRLSYPLVLAREREVTVTGTLDASSQSNAAPLFGFVFNADRLRVARLGLDANMAVGEQGRLRLTGLVSRGLSGFGARSTRDAAASGIPLSRPGAGPDFTKLEAGAAWDQVLPYGMQSRTSVRMQRAFGAPLPSAEMFSLDGEDALSSFDSGTLSDDGGWTLRQEIGRQFAAQVGDVALPVLPYLFVAAGRNDSRSSAPEGVSTAVGAGMRTSFKAVSLSLEYGRGRIRPTGGDQTKLFAKAQVAF